MQSLQDFIANVRRRQASTSYTGGVFTPAANYMPMTSPYTDPQGQAQGRAPMGGGLPVQGSPLMQLLAFLGGGRG